MTGFHRRLRRDQGAVFIHVAVGLLILLGFSALVVDYGMLWVARNQAQNSADAAALAGATSLAFDGSLPGDRWNRARNVAWNVGVRNVVWADAPGVLPESPYDAIPICEPNNGKGCIRVDVYRDGTNGSSSLETWFASLFAVGSQRTRAMAVAQSAPASGSNCLKPWLIPDRFTNNVGSPNDFDVGDVYVRPTLDEDGELNYGTGFTPLDIGTTLTLKPGRPNQAIAPGNFYAVDDPLFDLNGGNDYRNAIAGCVLQRAIGDIISIKDGNMIGPTDQGFADLIANSPNGMAIVTIGMFDPAAYASQPNQSGNQDIEIVNMLGFKLTAASFVGNTITGEIVGAPGAMVTGVCSVGPCPTSTGLINIIRLVR